MNRPTTKTQMKTEQCSNGKIERFEQGLGFHVAKRFVRNAEGNDE